MRLKGQCVAFRGICEHKLNIASYNKKHIVSKASARHVRETGDVVYILHPDTVGLRANLQTRSAAAGLSEALFSAGPLVPADRRERGPMGP